MLALADRGGAGAQRRSACLRIRQPHRIALRDPWCCCSSCRDFRSKNQHAERASAVLLFLLAGGSRCDCSVVSPQRAMETSRWASASRRRRWRRCRFWRGSSAGNARRENDRALAADAMQSATCAYLAAVTLAGLLSSRCGTSRGSTPSPPWPPCPFSSSRAGAPGAATGAAAALPDSRLVRLFLILRSPGLRRQRVQRSRELRPSPASALRWPQSAAYRLVLGGVCAFVPRFVSCFLFWSAALCLLSSSSTRDAQQPSRTSSSVPR